MKKYFTILAFVLAAGCALPSFAQKTEVHVSLNSGLFSFAGPSAVRATSIITDSYVLTPLSGNTSGYTNSVAGKLPGTSYGLSTQMQRVSRRNFIIGIGLGYEDLRSKVLINEASIDAGITYYSRDAEGKTILSNQFINATPYLGYRIKMREVALDLTAGFDVGYLLNSKEIGKAKTADLVVTTSRDRDWGIDFDVRPKAQIAISFQKFGTYAGYAVGIPNYYGEMACGNSKAYSRLMRFGVTYKIKG